MSHCFRENPHDLVILSHNLKWKLFLQGWSNQTTHQCYYAGHPAGILFFNQTLKVILETILQMEFINLLLWIFAEQPISCFVIVFLSSLLSSFPSSSFSLSVLTSFLSHFQWNYFHLGPLQLIFLYFHIFLHIFFFTCFDHLVMHSPHILTCIITVPQVNLKRNLTVVDDPFYSFVMRGKTFESVLNSQDPSDPSDDFYSECFIKR